MNFKREWSLKHRFPFRLGTTSYIIPADLLPNIAFLADKVDDIELVLYESDEITNLPDASSVTKMKEMADRFDLTYTVHMPLDIWMGHEDASIRRRSVDKCLRVIERTCLLDPFAYIVHFHGDRRGAVPSPGMERWIEGHRHSVERLLQAVDSKTLCVETLDYPYDLIDAIVSDYQLSICMDIGHLLLYAHTVEECLDRYLPWTRVIHLHGISEGSDHRSLTFIPHTLLADIVNRLATDNQKSRVLTIEIFDKGELHQSLKALSCLV